MKPAPSLERMAHLKLVAWELALASLARNGQPLPADRRPQVRAALPPEVRATVLRLAGAAPVTQLAGQASQQARSGTGRAWLTSREAAQALGLTVHGVRAACRRGRLTAARSPGGEWRIDPASVAEYRGGVNAQGSP